jgi:hypothetical protein
VNVTRIAPNRADVTFAALSEANVTSGRNRPLHVTLSSHGAVNVEQMGLKSWISTLTALSAVNVEFAEISPVCSTFSSLPRRNHSALPLNAAVLWRDARRTHMDWAPPRDRAQAGTSAGMRASGSSNSGTKTCASGPMASA